MAVKLLKVEGLQELEKWLEKAPKLALKELKIGMTNAVRLVQADLKVYPPQNSGPGRFSLLTGRPMGWYERGRGWWYPLMRKPTGPRGKGVGTIGPGQAGRAAGVAGYRLAKGGASEVLGKSWTTEVSANESGVTGVLGNDTSYLDYVQGDKQTRLHAAHQWRTIQQVLDANEDAVLDEFGAAIDRIIDTFKDDSNGQA